MWHALGIYEINAGIDPNWMKKTGIDKASWQKRYIYSLYWSVTTMITG
jgi:hypothetical protein